MAAKSDKTVAASITYKTRKIKAVVVSQKSGVARLADSLIPGGVTDEEVRSSHFTKYYDGTIVECIYRIREDGTNLLVSATPIDPDGRYQIFMSDFPMDNEELTTKLATILQDNMNFTPAEVTSVIEALMDSSDDAEGVAAISGILTYDEAHQWETWFLNEFPGTNVVTHKARKNARRTFADGSATSEPASLPDIHICPEMIDDHWMGEDERIIGGAIANMLNQGGCLNVASFGPSGYGKTTTFEAIGRWLGIPVIMMDCSVIQDTTEWFGYPEAREGSTLFVPTEFTEAIQQGNCLVVLDEFNRITPEISNSLFPILDHRRETTVHNHKVKVGPGVCFAMTLNIGIKYAGTNVIDAAMKNRIDLAFEVGPLPQRVELRILKGAYEIIGDQMIDAIVALVTSLRKTVDSKQLDVDVSTRTSLKMAKMISLGMTLEAACKYVIMTLTPDEDRKAIQDAANIILRSISARP